jgi:imidazole glycerol phosphate synthase glutamine amidotransferase subunit
VNAMGDDARVVVVRTGSANLASVRAAFARLGVETIVTDDPQAVVEARAAVLPGVGAFGPAMARLRARGLDEALVERCRRGSPLLAICLGLQLLCESSEESAGVTGLGVVSASVGRFAGTARVPQMGWNRIEAAGDGGMLRSDWMYFANSYRIERVVGAWRVATTEHGGTFVSAIERGSLLACQFHPELSGQGGLALLERWLLKAVAREEASC